MNNQNLEIFEKYESNVRSYCRKWPVEFSYAKGSIIVDESGKKFIDFFNGAGALNYGHNNDYIKEQLIKYIESDGIVHSLDMYASAKKNFIEYFENNILIPRGLNYKLMFANPTGTNAIEMAIKLARKNKKRSNIFICVYGGFPWNDLGFTCSYHRKGSKRRCWRSA